MSRLRPRSGDSRHRARASRPRKTDARPLAPCARRADAAPGDGQAGYTLLEFLVAFAILVAVLAALLAALSASVRSDQQAGFLTRATMLAKSKLAAAGRDFPLRPGTSAGRFENGWEWRAVMRGDAGAPAADIRAYGLWVEVTVSDGRGGGGRSMTLRSLELVPRRGP